MILQGKKRLDHLLRGFETVVLSLFLIATAYASSNAIKDSHITLVVV
jgi:hypothetical protein